MRGCRIDFMLVVFTVFIMTEVTFGQAPDTVWSHTYKTNSGARSLHEMPDGGFVLGGHVTPEGDGYRDFFIVRTDANGDTLWTREIGDDGRQESGVCLYPTADGGFIMTGNRGQDEPYSPYCDVYLVKTDQNGGLEWHTTLGTAMEGESSVAVVPAVGGGYFIAGNQWNSSTGADIWLFKTDTLGLLSWSNHFAWGDADYVTCLKLTEDGGLAITGDTQSFDAEYDRDMYILRLNQAGAEMWSDAYGSSHPYDESATHICQTSDGGYLMCGYRLQSGYTKDIYVVKTNPSGGIDWTSQLGGTYHDVGWSCIETVDGGYAVAASWYLNGNWKNALIKYDIDGDTSWTAFWGDSTNGHTPYGLVQTADNGFAVAGLMSGGPTKAYLVKFAADPGLAPHTFHVDGLGTPINNSTTTEDTLTIAIDPGDLLDRSLVGMRVTIDSLEHPAVEELAVSLSHDGTEVILVAEGEAAGGNFTGTVFTDPAVTIIGGGQAPYTGTFRPEELLGAFDGVDPNGEWILRVSDGVAGNDGALRAWGITLVLDLVVAADDEDNPVPLPEYSLSQCYPNPFNPATTIEYSVPKRSDVAIEVFNILGQKVTTLIDATKPAGEYRVTWNGDDSKGEAVAAGIYFYRFRAGDFIETRKMVLLK